MMKTNPKAKDIEYQVLSVAKYLRYDNEVKLGHSNSYIITGIVDAIELASQSLVSYEDGFNYILKTMSVKLGMTMYLDEYLTIKPETLYDIYSANGKSLKDCDKLVEQLCISERQTDKAIFDINKTKAFTFSELITLAKKHLFINFETNQPPNKYKDIVEQAIIISLITTYTKTPIEAFYNEKY